MATRAAATLDAAIAKLQSAGLNVVDGPVLTDDPSTFVWVGYDGDPEGDFTSILMNQDWAGSVGAKKRGERFSIVCAVVATTGNTDVKTARDDAFTTFAVVETALREDPSLGFGSPFVAGVKPLQTYTEPNGNGFQVRLTFNIDVDTRV